MGCCSSAPTADEWITAAHLECPDPLLPGMPRAMLMTHWPLRLGFGSNTNDDSGHGPPSTLSLTDADGTLLAQISMPPRRSFGIGASVTDAQGKPIAWLRTAQTERPFGFQSSSYRIFAARPQSQGQPPMVQDQSGAALYLWATVTLPGCSTKHTVTDSKGNQVLSGRTKIMYDTDGMQTYMSESRGAGACHMSKRPGVKPNPPMHDIRVAQGVDALLCVLVKLAADLAGEEVHQN